MGIHTENYKKILVELGNSIQLVAVSKTQSLEDMKVLYSLGQRDFGENYVQEMVDKQRQLTTDIRWHFIGHLQTNKVKYIAPFVHLIQGVDSYRLLAEIHKQAEKCGRVIDCLLQVHISMEETKFGLNEEELLIILQSPQLIVLNHIRICGLMGMSSFTNSLDKVRNEFNFLKSLFDKCKKLSIDHTDLTTLSMGMSQDYLIAIEEGATMVRIGSLLFGERIYKK